MSATANEDAVKSISNQEGQVGSHIKPSSPLEKGGHKPGVLASAADRAPEFSVETLPPGSAPSSHTHAPNNAPEVPAQATGGHSSATSTIGGATSSDVHTGLGHPGAGQTSTELRHDGGKKQGQGLAGVGANVGTDSKVVDAHDPGFASQRALGKEEGANAGQRGTVGGPPAEERLPESAERVAREAPRD